MGDKRAFDFGGSHAVTADVDHVVDAAGDPVVAVLVAAAAVASEVMAGEGGEIGLEEALVIAPDGAHLAGPALFDDKAAIRCAFEQLSLTGEKRGLDTEHGPRGRAGLERGRAGERGDHRAAGFGLPPGIDDRAAAFADDLVIPFPGLGIDRLADRTQEAQRLARGLLHPLVALAHHGAKCGGGPVEDLDAELVDHLPEAAGIGEVGYALEHHGGRAVEERAVHNIAVAGDPAHVCRAPVDLAGAVVEDVLVRHRGPDGIAAGGVEHALGLAGGAGSIEDEQRIFGAHFLRRAIGGLRGHGAGPVDVAAWNVGHIGTSVLQHNHGIDAGALAEGFIDIGFQRHALAAAQAFVRRDDEAAVAIADAAGEGIGREAGKDDRMDRADARAG